MRVAGTLLAVIVSLALVVATAPAQYGGEYSSPTPPPRGEAAWRVQARTAAQHAGFAAAADAVASVRQHLGHALNCIEGARGRNFNAQWGHVCQGQGNGILVDLRADRNGQPWLLVAEAAGELAVAGVRTQDLAQMKNAARGVGELMKLIAESR
ncbi:MAG: hypothetical protein QN163_00540 [Armatimonadota bacterium]|nr:hypothetical protein [Armatimonadota bacterium]MDR5696719.1 hypothetical protein [Armatimonadota bacterium]